MASRTFSLTGRNFLSRQLGILNKFNGNAPASSLMGVGSPTFSTKVHRLNDPSTFVQGITVADIEKDPNMAEYFAANFPEYGTGSDDDAPSSSSAASANEETDAKQEAEEQTSPLNIRTLSSFIRNPTETGSQPCYRLRERSQLIPGIIYGSDPTKNIFSHEASSKMLVMTPWEQIQRELDLFTYHNFESRVYDLTVYKEDDDDDVGEVHRVIPTDVQFHPIQNKLYCCNFLRYHAGRPIQIPITYINEDESGALKRGGFVVPQTRHVSCLVDEGVPIPEVIEMDSTGLNLKDVIRLDRLIFPEGVRPSKRVKKESFLVGTVFGRGADEETTVEGEEEAEEE